MEALFDIQKLSLFAVCVFPGLVSIHVYRLMMPAKALKWESAVLEGLFYSIVNFALLNPLLLLILRRDFHHEHWFWFWLVAVAVFIVGPVLWPILYVRAIRSEFLAKHLQTPYPTSWDFFFDQRRQCFLIVHLTDGNIIGGFFGTGSFAAGFPHQGNLYIEAVYQLDEEGHFLGPVPNTRGILLRSEDYAYIEMFDIPSA